MRSVSKGAGYGLMRGSGHVLALVVAAGAIAGLASWAWGERWYDYHQPSFEALSQPYDHTQLLIEQSEADAKNAAIAYGGLGFSLGLAMGLAGGLASGSARRAAVAGAVGAILGGALAAGTAYVLTPIYIKHQDPASTDLNLPLVMHSSMGCAAGLAAGLAFGWGSGGIRMAALGLLGGLVGAAIGAVAFELIAAIVFPRDRTTQIISPTSRTRLMARMLITLFAAIGAGLSIRGASSKPASLTSGNPSASLES